MKASAVGYCHAMKSFAVFLTLFFAGISVQAERSPAPKLEKAADLYSWRTADGGVIFGLQIDDKPATPEILMEDKKYQILTQAELGQALEKLGVGEQVKWHHRNQRGADTRPPEEVEVETKETALKARINLSLANEGSLEPEYWNQPRGRYDNAVQKLSEVSTDIKRAQNLRVAAKEAFALGLYPEAKRYAAELEIHSAKIKEDWNYGDAVQDFNIILGRVAVVDGDLDTARGCLLGAGYSPGSPVMNTLGPDMNLANDLLKKDERKIVLQYLDLCRNFWKTDHGLIDQWTLQIKNGKTPDFGTNLRE